jgi:putative DNA primase/helicase
LLCAGLASVLLQPMERESTFVIITAGSSKGKSTVLKLVSALFGPPTGIVTWEATDNGLEAATRKHHHKPFVIDEIGQGSGALFAKASYRLTNLSGKLRAGPDGELLPASRSFSIVIAAGEQSPIAMMSASGIAVQEGQRARLLCIPAEKRHGIWSTIEGFPSGAKKSKQIAAALSQCYGVAGPAFCAYVASRLNSLMPRYAAAAPRWRKKIRDGCKFKSSDGVVDRALESFVLFAYAGMLAVEAKAVQWTSKQVLHAVRHGFKSWYEEHRQSMPMTDAAIMQQVRLFFQSKRGMKFKPFSTYNDNHAGELAGYEHQPRGRTDPLFLVYPAYFEKEICKGLDKGRVLKLLLQHGLLVPGARDIPTKQFHVPGRGNTNASFYAVKQSILLA